MGNGLEQHGFINYCNSILWKIAATFDVFPETNTAGPCREIKKKKKKKTHWRTMQNDDCCPWNLKQTTCASPSKNSLKLGGVNHFHTSLLNSEKTNNSAKRWRDHTARTCGLFDGDPGVNDGKLIYSRVHYNPCVFTVSSSPVIGVGRPDHAGWSQLLQGEDSRRLCCPATNKMFSFFKLASWRTLSNQNHVSANIHAASLN